QGKKAGSSQDNPASNFFPTARLLTGRSQTSIKSFPIPGRHSLHPILTSRKPEKVVRLRGALVRPVPPVAHDGGVPHRDSHDVPQGSGANLDHSIDALTIFDLSPKNLEFSPELIASLDRSNDFPTREKAGTTVEFLVSQASFQLDTDQLWLAMKEDSVTKAPRNLIHLADVLP